MSKIVLPKLDITDARNPKREIKTSYRDSLVEEKYPEGLVNVFSVDDLNTLGIENNKWLKGFSESRMNVKVAKALAIEAQIEPVDTLQWLQPLYKVTKVPNIGKDSTAAINDYLQLSKGINIDPEHQNNASHIPSESIQEIDLFTSRLVELISFKSLGLTDKTLVGITSLDIRTVADLLMVTNPEMKKAGITDGQKDKLITYFENVSGMTKGQRREVNDNTTLKYLLAMKNCVSKAVSSR